MLFALEIMEWNGFGGTDQFLERNGTLFYGMDHCWNGTKRHGTVHPCLFDAAHAAADHGPASAADHGAASAAAPSAVAWTSQNARPKSPHCRLRQGNNRCRPRICVLPAGFLSAVAVPVATDGTGAILGLFSWDPILVTFDLLSVPLACYFVSLANCYRHKQRIFRIQT